MSGCRMLRGSYICLIHWTIWPMADMAVASWTLLAENDGPSARAGHAAAFGNQVLWIFGGKDEAVLRDLWLFHEAAQSWTSSAITTSDAPSARKEHVAVTDGNGDLWIHGGQDDSVFFKDLWKLSANTWTLISNRSVPSRSSHVGVWDSLNGALWIHGGFDGVLRQDIWKFEAERGRWFSITDDYNRPSARAHHVAALDEMSGVIWIHGGYDESLLGDLWKFDTQTYAWNLISTDGPSARAHHVAVWDTLNQALWIHGGFDGMACQDMWRFEQLSSTWNIVAQSGPSARYDHVAAWDGIHSMILVHGGYDQGFRRDLWKFEVPVITSTRTETPTSMTSSRTTTSITRSTVSTSTASIPPALETSTEELPSDVLALILALSVLGVALCLVTFYWYRKRQKNREAVVPVPPPMPPPLPPHEPPPPSPRSPQLRVNMQVLVPPPSPQQPPPKPQQSRTSAFPAYVPLSIPEPHQLPICAPKCCASNVPPLPDEVEDLKPQAHASCASGRPRAPRRTERAANLPNLPSDLPSDLPRFSERSQICGSPRQVSTIGDIASPARPLPVQGIQCKVCGKCRKVGRNAVISTTI